MTTPSRTALRVGVAALALALFAVAAWLLSGDDHPAPPDADGSAAASQAASTRQGDLAEAGPAERERREPVVGPDPKPGGQSAPAEPSDTLLRGRVVRRTDGTPIEGASVTLQFRDADDFWNLDMQYGERIETLGTTRTDADGRFALSARPARSHRVEVQAHGFAARVVPDCVPGSTEELVIALGRGAELTGNVHCEGEPLVDVPVRIAVVGESVELASVRTDPTGSFHLSALEPATVFAQVLSPDHTQTWERIQLEEGVHHRVDIEVPPSRTVAGRVLDAATGRPVRDAEVATSWTFRSFVTTHPDGSFSIGAVGRDEVAELHVAKVGYADATHNALPDHEGEVVIELERGASITGRITGPDGEGLGDAYVAVGASFMTRPGMQHTDWIRADLDGGGTFHANGLRSDQSYWLYARLDGFGTRVYALPRGLDVGRTLDVGRVVLRPAGGIAGRVLDEDGEPLERVEVTLRGRNDDALSWRDGAPPGSEVIQFESRDQRSAGDGSFHFTDVAAGTYSVIVRPRGVPQPTATEVAVTDGTVTSDVELVVERGATITGRVRRADGRALDDIAGELRILASHSASASVANDGSFTLRGLDEDQEYSLTLMGAPEDLAAAPARAVAAGSRNAELLLEPTRPIRGRVVDGDGEGRAAYVWVTWEPPLRTGAPLFRSAGDGTFEIGVPPGFVGVVHAKPLDMPIPSAKLEDVRAGDTDLELILR